MTPSYVICIDNREYEDDLHVRTVYQVIEDADALRSGYLRVVDETGEDYLYPTLFFVPITIPEEATIAFT